MKKLIYFIGAITAMSLPIGIVVSCGSLEDKILIELNNEQKRVDKRKEWKKEPSKDKVIELKNIHEYIDDPALDPEFSIEPIKVEKLNKNSILPVTFKLWKDNYEQYTIKIIVYYHA